MNRLRDRLTYYHEEASLSFMRNILRYAGEHHAAHKRIQPVCMVEPDLSERCVPNRGSSEPADYGFPNPIVRDIVSSMPPTCRMNNTLKAWDSYGRLFQAFLNSPAIKA